MKTKKFKIQKREIIVILITLVVGLSLGGFFFGNSSSNNADNHNHVVTQEAEHTIWTCSMHPQIREDGPGSCPICGMDLIPLVNDVGTEEVGPDEIQMTKAAMKLAEVQTYIVEEGSPEKSVSLFGKVMADERNMSELTARFGGRIEKLYVNFTGQSVKKGQKLASIYSPELNTARQELLDAVKHKDANPSFYKATRNKLKLWELTDKQIKAIEQGKQSDIYFDVLSPISGTVTRRDVAIGDYVKEGTPLFEVINLSKVWVMFDAYESDLPWIKLGDTITFTAKSLPGNTYTAKVSYIDPIVNSKTRVVKVRVNMNNKNMDFKPGMFVNGILKSQIAEGSSKILIPKTSILWTGKRAVVYVKVPNREIPSFVYREITLGPDAGEYYVVANGLAEGEEIASSGVFKIDASAQLLGKPSMMNPEGGKISTGHNHGGKKMTAEEMEEFEKQEKSKTESTDTPMEFKMQLGKVVDQYLILKDAFVKTDEKAVESAAQKTLDALNKVDMNLLTGESHLKWMKLKKPITDNLTGIIQMKGIEMKRSHFSIVSDKLTEAIEEFGVHSTKTASLYLEFCPMAFDNTGAYWVSETKEISNPYFGDVMLKCGEVKKEL